MGQKEKKNEFLKLNGKKIISFHFSKMLYKPNNYVKFHKTDISEFSVDEYENYSTFCL